MHRKRGPQAGAAAGRADPAAHRGGAPTRQIKTASQSCAAAPPSDL